MKTPAEQMASAMSKCFDLEHKAEIGNAISMVAAYYLDAVVGGGEQYKERGLTILNASVRAYLGDRSALIELIREERKELH